MIETLTVDGYSIHRANNLWVVDLDGLGAPEVRQVRQAKPRRHGAIDSTSLYGPRVLALRGWCGLATNGATRTAAADAFDQLKTRLSVEASHLLVLRRPGRTADEQLVVRMASDIQCTYQGYGEVIEYGCEMVAPDPRFYATALTGAQRTGAGSWTATNGGLVPTPPILTVTGASNAGALTITNNAYTPGRSINLTGLPALAAAATIVIDVANRTVTYAGANHPEVVTVATTDWWTLIAGGNSLAVSGTALAAGTVVRADWRAARI